MVIYVKDRTGRFNERPHYKPAEIDFECEKLVTEFLLNRYGEIKYPFSTEDLTILIERDAQDLDLYADLSSEGQNVEGVTDFYPGKKPSVRIAKELSEQAHKVNRLRTTLAHEYGHVRFHRFLWDTKGQELELFEQLPPSEGQKCKRESIVGASVADWMEWQAGYASGAILMPVNAIKHVVKERIGTKNQQTALTMGSPEYLELIQEISSRFMVSGEAASVRLLQLKIAVHEAPSLALPL